MDTQLSPQNLIATTIPWLRIISYLTIHKATPGAYTCMLISTRRNEIDTKTQHVVTESKLDISDCLILQ